MLFSFSKWQGAGNDFILIEDQDEIFPLHESEKIARLCHRQLGVGADGILLLQRSRKAAFKMRYFNADGFEADMCGNGLRCLFSYGVSRGLCLEEDRIETRHSTYLCKMQEREVRVAMGIPKILSSEISHADFSCGYIVDTGVLHLVIFNEQIDSLDVDLLGRKIRQSESFSKEGINVNFAKAPNKSSLHLRTYERGVEAETLACGTGVLATAFIAHKFLDMSPEIDVRTRSNEHLKVVVDSQGFCALIGPAEKVFTGEFVI